ncbi:MAG: hypothetical protein EOS40_06765 [Mesorhizobium sp.]|nr:MAG: hypothetical protein EOS40_06765 [Mesorhizobium sp.]
MMPKSVKRFSDDIMLYLFDLEPDSDFGSTRSDHPALGLGGGDLSQNREKENPSLHGKWVFPFSRPHQSLRKTMRPSQPVSIASDTANAP